MGAWIETWATYAADLDIPSRPTWARGLKLLTAKVEDIESVSRPTWARGLKQRLSKLLLVPVVAPHVGAWIET